MSMRAEPSRSPPRRVGVAPGRRRPAPGRCCLLEAIDADDFAVVECTEQNPFAELPAQRAHHGRAWRWKPVVSASTLFSDRTRQPTW